MRRQPRGQSFVELMLVMTFLALLLAGMVEFGFMLNKYLHVLDGAREAARISNTDFAFIQVGQAIAASILLCSCRGSNEHYCSNKT